MRSTEAALVAWVVLGALLAAGPAAAQPQAFGVSPGSLSVADAQPGESYLRSVQVQNQVDSPSTITVATQGDGGAWVQTDPASGFTMPPRTNREVALTITVPHGTGPGNRTFDVTFTTDPKSAPDGTGAAVRFGAGVHVEVDVGGQAVTHVTYLSARIDNVTQQGSPVHAYVLARNDGNVRATASAEGTVLPFAADSPAGPHAQGSQVLVPGQEGEVVISFPADLPAAQYRAHLSADAFDTTLPFKVALGAAPDGVLRAIVHAPRGRAGTPLPIQAWFQDTGNVSIASAVFDAEVRDADGAVLALLRSDPLHVAPGQSVNLSVVWTPPRAGVYHIIGHVTYDGYQTLPDDDTLSVEPGAASFPWWWLLLLLVVAVGIVLAALLWRRRQDRDERRR
jgi:hypothetical protein